MKILFLTPQLPYPAVSGGLIKTLKMIQFLSNLHDVEVGFFIKEESIKVSEDLASFKKLVAVKVFHRNLNVERTGLNFLKSIMYKVPLSIYRNKDSAFAKLCKEKSQHYDVIFVDHFLMFQYVPEEWHKKIILHQHNAEFIMWDRYADTQHNVLKKILLRFESERIKKYEKYIIERATSVLASTNDIALLSSLSHRKINFTETLHLGDEELLEAPALVFEQTTFSLLYIGTLTWEANREGLLWFLKNVWSDLKKKFPALVFDIVGKNNDSAIFSEWLQDKQIKWHGFVDDLSPFYNNARVSVAPLNFGSGIKVKVINALYRGLPMVTTTIGVEGLVLKQGEEIFISDNSSEQCDYISMLLTDKVVWERFSTNSRAIAHSLYSWDGVLKKINQVIIDD